MSFLPLGPAKPRNHHEKPDLGNQTDYSATRVREYQRHTHQDHGEDVGEALFLLNRTGEEHAERKRDCQFHVTGEMVAVDKRPKSRALRKLPNPIHLRSGEGLRQTKDRENKTKNRDCSDQEAKAMWRVGKYQSRGKVDQK